MKQWQIFLLLLSLFCICSLIPANSATNSPPKKYVIPGPTWTTTRNGYDYSVVVLEGHRYAVRDGSQAGGIVHAHSCPCMNK